MPAITQAYVTSRLESVQLMLGVAGGDDMLDSEEALAEQLDSLPYLVRFQVGAPNSEFSASALCTQANDIKTYSASDRALQS